MNEEVREKLELLKVMKDLNGQGFRLNNEINALIRSMLYSFNITETIINGTNKKRKGTSNDPYKKVHDHPVIIDSTVYLCEIPNVNEKVKVNHLGKKLLEISNNEITDRDKYFVDYKQGIIHFHSSLNGYDVSIEYLGTGENFNKR